jgi:uncharacterized protein (TIGR02996 family)
MKHDNSFLRRIARRIATDEHDEAFLYDILGNFSDQPLRRIYADWLFDRGDPRGEYMHISWEMTHRQRRGLSLRRLIDPLWLGFVMGEDITGVVTRMNNHAFKVDFGDGIVGWCDIADLSS